MASIIFMGTPEFAVPALEALHHQHGVSTVVTVPDRQKGRGLHLQPSAVKTAAMGLGITDILQPTSLRDESFVGQIRQRTPDIICVIAFRILPRSVYSLAQNGAFNVHASLLPKYRGAAPINHAILNGESVTGVTSFLLNDVVDTGTVIEQRMLPIADDMTAGELYEALMPLAADCAVSTVDKLISGQCSPLAQNDREATPAPKIFRETAVVDWTRSREHVRNLIRAYSPAPTAWTVWNEQVLKIYRASRSNEPVPAGQWNIIGQTLVAGCADGALSLDEVQLPGKRRMPIADIVRGYRGLPSGTFSPLPSEHKQ